MFGTYAYHLVGVFVVTPRPTPPPGIPRVPFVIAVADMTAVHDLELRS